jgi:hypothetical protein
MKQWFKVLFSGAAILLVAVLLRIYNLTIIPVFADEAIYIRWSQIMRNVPELRFLPLSDGKQPLFMWATIPFFKLFSDPLFAGRSLSVLCGLGTMVGVGVLTWILFALLRHPGLDPGSASNSGMGKRQIAGQARNDGYQQFILPLLAMFLYAISPFALFFDRLALADSMLSMFGIWTFIFAILAIKFQRLDAAMIAGFCLGGAFLTKSPALYFALLLPTTILSLDFDKKRRTLRIIKTIGLWCVTWGIGYGFYNILRLGTNFQMLKSRSLDYVYPINHILSSPFDPLKPFLMEVVRWLWIMGPSVFIILAILGVLFNWKKSPRQIIFLTILAIAPILASAEYAKVFTARYIFFSIPYFIILAASVVNALDASLLSGKLRVGILGLLGAFVFHSLFIDYCLLFIPQSAPLPRSERSGYLEEWTAGYGIKEIAIQLKKEQSEHPEEKIVVGTEGYFGTLPDGLQMYLNDAPSITVIGVGEPIRDVHTSLLESKKAGNKTYLVVNDSRFLGDSDKLNLQLIQKYPKAEKFDGGRENLLLFEVK